LQIDQEYEVVRIDGDDDPLKEHPRNPNKGAEETIDESIDENGWYGAVTAQRSTGYIIAGNHRYRVAKKKGATEIPVIWKDVDDETALKILLVDNKSTRDGEMDEGLLEELLSGLETLDGTGYTLASAQEQIENPGASSPSANGDEPPGPDDVPEDKHEPQFSVIILCKSERQQEETYRWLKDQMPKRELRMTAV
jgi:hypothetical protein